MKLSDALFKVATIGCRGCPRREFCSKRRSESESENQAFFLEGK